ncbi:DUF3857 and transglutaminase domain-containing protein [Puniceicoccaceae bacterium K14]|nr:DUF3857 and transglutaminase domain-containing protein [Puniceicoccaceae bacterium K14]
MPTPFASFIFTLFLVLVSSTQLGAKNNIPSWLQQAHAIPEPPKEEGERKSGIIVLWDEGIYEILPTRRISRTVRYAIKVIDNKASDRAIATIKYNAKSEKISSFNAWSVDEDGEAYKYKKKDQIDKGLIGGHLYRETRTRTINGASRTHKNDVFAYEYTTEEFTIFTQYHWRFHQNSPVAFSKLSITYPETWNVRETLRNGAPNGIITGNTISWEMRNLESIKNEEQAPSSSRTNSQLCADITPPQNSKLSQSILRFDSWESIANYQSNVADPMSEPNEDITQKAHELTQNATNDWEKIQAIGNYSRALTYAGISMDVAKGGGYAPRPASETFRVSYGDCKDKTALMRAMLKSVGINSYSVAVNAINNDAVDTELPSTYYFNHCIAAIEVDHTINKPAVSEDTDLGRILFVDPTSELTPIGELPFVEQGGWALVGKPGLSELIRLPEVTPLQNCTKRSVEAELLPNGTLLAIINTTFSGNAGDVERRTFQENGESNYEKLFAKHLASDNSIVKVDLLSVNDNSDSDLTFHTKIACGLPKYSKSMRGKFLVFNPTILGRLKNHPFVKPKRTMPILLRPKMLESEAKFHIPEGFKVDEFNESIEIVRDYASYRSSIRIEGNELYFDRKFITNSATVPADAYEDIQAFYNEVITAENSPIVLSKTEG